MRAEPGERVGDRGLERAVRVAELARCLRRREPEPSVYAYRICVELTSGSSPRASTKSPHLPTTRAIGCGIRKRGGFDAGRRARSARTRRGRSCRGRRGCSARRAGRAATPRSCRARRRARRRSCCSPGVQPGTWRCTTLTISLPELGRASRGPNMYVGFTITASSRSRAPLTTSSASCLVIAYASSRPSRSKFQVAVSSHGLPSVDRPTATTDDVCTSRGTPAAMHASITFRVPSTLRRAHLGRDLALHRHRRGAVEHGVGAGERARERSRDRRARRRATRSADRRGARPACPRGASRRPAWPAAMELRRQVAAE